MPEEAGAPAAGPAPWWALPACMVGLGALAAVETVRVTAARPDVLRRLGEGPWWIAVGLHLGVGAVLGLLAWAFAAALRRRRRRAPHPAVLTVTTPVVVGAAAAWTASADPEAFRMTAVAAVCLLPLAHPAAWWAVDALASRAPRVRTSAAAVVTVAALALPAGWLVGAGARAADDRPAGTVPDLSVLLVTMDTTRADVIGCYAADGDTPRARAAAGAARTPVLDRLAAEGVRFTDAWAPSSMTSPSHVTILTGRNPGRHGVLRNATALPPGERTLADDLRESGRAACAVTSVEHLGPAYGFGRGFDAHLPVHRVHRMQAWTGTPRDPGMVLPAVVLGGSTPGLVRLRSSGHQRAGDRTVDDATRWLRRRGDRPFFLWVHLFDPHEPYTPPAEHADAFARARDAVPGEASDPGRATRDWRAYRAEVAFMDTQIGRLLDAARTAAGEGGLLTVVTADHGELLGEHDAYGHGQLLWREETRVPLIVHGPGIARGRVVRDTVGVVDVTPTVLEAVGRTARLARDPGAPGGMDGRSLWPRIAAGDGTAPGTGRTVLQELHTWGGREVLGAVRAPHHWMESRAGGPPAEGGRLHHLERDPRELEPLPTTGDAGRVAANLRAAVDAWHARFDRDAAGDLTAEQRAMLRAMGYLK